MSSHTVSLTEADTNLKPQTYGKAIISVCNVGKMYRIYEKPVDRLKQMFLWRTGRNYGQEFWALHNVSFDIQRGETVGIIGRNGSGKSTLLQIVAGTITPTEGEVDVQGRIAALLELGSGFNPEFTGRENVFMNGAILGMSHEQMQNRFDDIIAFADIGDFIEQPVKMYSSGMVLRLAFAVQMHVDADILIVDEALSVGDVFFQAKCSRALQDFSNNGGTILFVSHDMFAVERLCKRGLVLHQGATAYWGNVAQAVYTYYHIGRSQAQHTSQESSTFNSIPSEKIQEIPHALALMTPTPIRRQSATGNGTAFIEEVYITNEQGESTTKFDVNQWMHVYAIASFDQDVKEVDFGAGLSDRSAVLLGGAHSWYVPEKDKSVSAKSGERWIFHVKVRLSLIEGEYLLLVGLARNYSMSVWEDIYVILDACIVHISGRPQFWGQQALESIVFDAERL